MSPLAQCWASLQSPTWWKWGSTFFSKCLFSFWSSLFRQMYVCQLLNCERLFETLWIVARQAPLSMGFSRQEYWSGSPFPSPGDLPDPRIKPNPADSLPSEPPGKLIQVCKNFFLVNDIGHKIFVCEVVQKEQGERACET